MAINDKSVHKSTYGTIFYAPVGTALPDNPLEAFKITADEVTVGTGANQTTWKNLGHTSANNMAELTINPGDANSSDTWIKKNFRTTYGDASAQLSVKALQIDKETLQLVYNGTLGADGGVEVDIAANPKILALVLVAQETPDDTDPAKWLVEMRRTSITPDGGPTLSRDDFVEQGLIAQIEDPGNNKKPLHFVMPTAAD